MLAYRLKLSIKEIENMTTHEFMEWLAFFDLYSKSQPNAQQIISYPRK